MAKSLEGPGRLLAAVVAAVLTIAGAPAWAGAYEDGEKAYWEHDYATALQLLKPLAEQGDLRAEQMLGFMYLNGFGVQEDKAMAVNWILRAAVNGSAPAETSAGHAYFEGWGMAVDLPQAAKWFRRAADQGDAEGQEELGAMYENGFGVPQDFVEAMKWSILAIEHYPAPQAESRRIAAVNRDRQAEHLNGSQIEEAERRADDWTAIPFKKTSEDDLLEAGLALARNDYGEAARLFRPLAEQGSAEAQVMLGALYSVGSGVAEDQAESVKWFRLAAEQGDAGGAYSLAAAYEDGKAVPRDDLRAFMWYDIAATSGDPYAAKFAQARDKLAGRMTPGQIARARSMAAVCKTSHYKDCG
jgi:TPR repeat protein